MAARGAIFALLGALTLAGCDLFPSDDITRPIPRPVVPTETPPQSADSLALERFYTKIEANLLAENLLRTDGGADVAWDAEDLTRNFIRIAAFEEFDTSGAVVVQRQTESRLHRWEKPVRIGIEFGETVSPVKRLEDTVAVRRLARRLSTATGHPIRMTNDAPNFHVFIVNEDERRALGPRLRALLPNISDSAIDTVVTLPRTSYCLVFAVAPERNGIYSQAVAIIRGEHPDLLRQSCLHEEITQGLGLSNDNPLVRPSIFNDDEEFALLTRQDEAMLAILYDPRIVPNMTGGVAEPIVREIAREITGEAIGL